MVIPQLENGDTVVEHLRGIPNQLQAALTGKLGEEADKVAARIRENASGAVVQAQTGALADSVQVSSVEASGGSASVTITGGGDAYYGKILERGTKAFEERGRFRPAGTLSPKGRKLKAREGAHALKFMTGGSVVFAKVVEHPAIAPHPWFTSALDEFKETILHDLTETVADVVEAE